MCGIVGTDSRPESYACSSTVQDLTTLEDASGLTPSMLPDADDFSAEVNRLQEYAVYALRETIRMQHWYATPVLHASCLCSKPAAGACPARPRTWCHCSALHGVIFEVSVSTR